MDRHNFPEVQHAVRRLAEWKGQWVEVVEQITRLPGNLDPHFTTRSALIMELETSGISFNGTVLSLWGKVHEMDVSYQASCDALIKAKTGATEIELIEAYGKNAERHTHIILIEFADESEYAEEEAP